MTYFKPYLNLVLVRDVWVCIPNCTIMSNSLWPHGLQQSKLLYPWDFLGKNTRLSAISSSRGSSRPRHQTHIYCSPALASEFYTNESPGKPDEKCVFHVKYNFICTAWYISGDFWQNVVHWRSEWQTTPTFLPWESNEPYENEKDMTLEDEPLRSEGIKYATGRRRGQLVIAPERMKYLDQSETMLSCGCVCWWK